MYSVQYAWSVPFFLSNTVLGVRANIYGKHNVQPALNVNTLIEQNHCCKESIIARSNKSPKNACPEFPVGSIKGGWDSTSKHALLSKVGKCFKENQMAVDIGIFVLHMLVCISVSSDLAKLHCSNPDQHRGEGSATE